MVTSRSPEPHISGVVPSTYVRLLFEYLEAQGIDAPTLLGEPAPEPGRDGLGRFPVAHWVSLIAHAAQHLDDPLLGLKVGRTITPAHLGVLGYVLLACDNLAAALQRFERYQRLIYDVNPVSHALSANAVELTWGVDAGRPGALADECAIAALVQFSRDITGQAQPAAMVHFVNARPADTRPYEAFFGCPVRFEQPVTMVRFPLSYLALPLRRPDPGLVGMLEQQANALLEELPSGNDFERMVRRAIVQLLREGEPGLEHVAALLHVSTRTLHRRLEERGLNFREVQEDIRHRLAMDYLRDLRLTLSEVGQLLGYSEQSAFTRAFRRWSGNSPRRWRQQQALSGAE